MESFAVGEKKSRNQPICQKMTAPQQLAAALSQGLGAWWNLRPMFFCTSVPDKEFFIFLEMKSLTKKMGKNVENQLEESENHSKKAQLVTLDGQRSSHFASPGRFQEQQELVVLFQACEQRLPISPNTQAPFGTAFVPALG